MCLHICVYASRTSTFIFVYPCFLCVCLGPSVCLVLTDSCLITPQAGVVARPLWRLSPAWENGVKKDAGNYWEWVLWFIVIVIFKKALHSFNPLTWWSKNAQTTVVAKWGWMPTFLVSLDSSPLYSEFLVRKLQMVDSSCCCSELMLSDAPNMDRTK